MLRELAGSNKLTLTENKRSDQVLYDFYTGLAKRTLDEALQEARMIFPVTDKPPGTTLVISHARRRFLNMKRNLKEKPANGAVFLRAPMTGAKVVQAHNSCGFGPGFACSGLGDR